MVALSDYIIGETLYKSSKSLICRASHKADNHTVILKILTEDYLTQEHIAQFKREYQITQALNQEAFADESVSPVGATNGIQKHELGLAIIMEDIGGESLDRWVKSGGIELTDNGMITFLKLAIAIIDALSNIHQHSVVHKNINPSHIIFNPLTGQVKIVDFGIASLLARENPKCSIPNVLEGTLAYISPEQTGRMNRVVDYRTDYYSLGATFYELLTGHVPFSTDDLLELIYSHIAKQPVALHEIRPGIPAAVSDIIDKLLSKEADDRYHSARGLRADLKECLHQWMTKGLIEPFPLGRFDISDRFQIPLKLYGREQEIESILAAFERICAGSSEIMLVSGSAGIGKTALVQEIVKPVTSRRGYFISGKFDQFQQNVPYSALIQAFQSLILQLLMENEAAVAQWREIFQSALGLNGQVIVDVIPDVELIIGPQPPPSILAYAEAENRFLLVFQNFIRVFTKIEHPFVLFIDDLQWADEASLKLIEQLLTTPDNRYLFFIGAYRDTEMFTSHRFIRTLDTLSNSCIDSHNIILGPLSMKNVDRLIADTLHCTPDKSSSLADLILAKTGGNPFYLLEFFKSLHGEDLIKFDFHSGTWQWDLVQIQAHGIMENIVDLITAKTRLLRQETQYVLKMAACMGNTFDLKSLAYAYEKSPHTTVNDLWPAITAGLVLPLSTSYRPITLRSEGIADEAISEYKFSHDRVQQAVYSMLLPEEKEALHLQIGQRLFHNAHSSERESRIFDIVNQLNQARGLIKDHPGRNELAELNLLAGEKAKTSAAYNSALSYLKVGIELLGNDCWKADYKLALKLFVDTAEVAYLNGDFEMMEHLADEVLMHTNTLIDKVKMYEIKIQARIAQNKHMESIQIAVPVLRLLGVKLPAKPNKLHVVHGFLRTKAVLAVKRVEDLINLPAMTDPYKLAAVRILTKIGSAAYIATPALMPLLIFKGVILSLRYGIAPETAFGFVAYGMILCGRTGDIESGYQFGKLAMRMLERFSDKRIESRTVFSFHCFIQHWKEHLRETLEPLQQGYHSGLQVGDLEFAARSISTFCNRLFFVGAELEEVERHMTVNQMAVQQLKQESPHRFFEPFHQIVLNLLERNTTPRQIVVENFDITQMAQLDHEDNRVFAFYLYLSKLILHYLFEEIPQAIENANMAEKYLEGAMATAPKPLFYLYSSLARIAFYNSSSKAEQKNILRNVSAMQKELKKWAQHAPMNYLHKFYMIEAERGRILGRYKDAEKFYDKAIDMAREHEYLNEEALAYELAGKFYLSQGKSKIAHAYMQDAYYTYVRWGALAKVRDLEARYPKLLTHVKDNTSVDSYSHIATNTILQQDARALDVTTIIKASQAISGEIVLNQLLTKLMTILIENAGAQRGFLAIEKDGVWTIEEEGATSIINYVIRTQEIVVLSDATHEGIFITDPYITARHPKSILCMPLIHQGKLIGVLYLENNLITNAFTPERLEVLRLLSGQMAISIINARLYDELEQRVQERTSELSRANVNLVQEISERKRAEEALKLDELRMEALIKLNTMDDCSMDDIINFALEELTILTKSEAGYIAFTNDEETVLVMHSWSKKATEECVLRYNTMICPMEKTGLWAEPVRQKKTIITNDYSAPNPLKKGYPTRHFKVTRHLGVPFIVGDHVIMTAGVANKAEDYDDSDVRQATLMLGGIWKVIERHKNENALKDSQKLLSDIINYLPDATLVIDMAGTVIAWNQAIEEMTGVKAENIVGKGNYEYSLTFYGIRRPMMIDLVFGHDEEIAQQYLYIRKEGDVFVTETNISLKGKNRVIWAKASPLYDSAGKIVGAIESFRDISDRKQMETELLQAKNTAEEAHHIAEAASRAKSTFLANMSHEIRTPLNSIVGFTNLFSDTELSTKQRDYLQKISISSQNLLGLINDILDFSKIEAGKLDLDNSVFDLQSIMDHLYNMFIDSATKKGITMNISIARNVPSTLVGDPLRLRQVVINLVNNAIKFTDAGKVSISVRLENMDSQKVRLLFSIMDTGIGIPEEALTRIFDTFTQADGSMTRRFGGTGLGLSICKGLIEIMGGEIWVESTVGTGSTFYFTADFNRTIDGHTIKKCVIQSELIMNIRGAQVLLVEDNIINQQLAKEFLEGAGLVVNVANNGVEALEAIRIRNYDAVLMDVQMPLMSGYEAARLIRGNPLTSHVPIIAMTAHVISEAQEECLSAGMNDYITKPIDKYSLLSVLTRWIKPKLPRMNNEPETVCGKMKVTALEPALPDSLPGIDVSSALKRLGGNTKLLVRLFKVFCRDFADTTKGINAALASNNIEKAVRLAHTVKGVASNLSAEDLRLAAAELEKSIKQEPSDSIESRMNVFDIRLQQVIESLSLLELNYPDEITIKSNFDPNIEWSQEISTDIKESILQIEKESMLLWEKAKEKFIFDELYCLGQHIKAQGEKFKIKPIEQFGDSLLDSVRNFDIENIKLLLNYFPMLISRIKSL